MKEQVELTVIAKAYDLILWSCNHTSQFPRNHGMKRHVNLPAVGSRGAGVGRRWGPPG